MTARQNTALVVDDEYATRAAIARALRCKGFSCDLAANGEEALQRAACGNYDIVVTDLRMPEKNGHALAVELLELENRPLIVVQTGVVEPRLAADLLRRGVDDIVYKPTDQILLASKIRAMVDKRAAEVAAAAPARVGSAVTEPEVACKADSNPQSITWEQIENKLPYVSQIVPISRTALDVFSMANSRQCDASDIAKAIEKDAALASEVLRLANSTHYNPSGEPIVNLEQAVARIGQRRIAEMAIAVNALSALTASAIPWLDVDLTWKRSLAAGIAADLLLGGQEQHPDTRGLMLCAIMHQLGRIVSATLYGSVYATLVEQCRIDGCSLLEKETQVFPANHARIMARLLVMWNVPPQLCMPFGCILDNYSDVEAETGTMRRRIDLVKIAITLAEFAVGRWESWDVIDLPPATLMRQICPGPVSSLISRIRRECENVTAAASLPTWQEPTKSGPPFGAGIDPIEYFSFTDLDYDLLAPLISSIGIPLVDSSGAGGNPARILLNCMDASKESLRALCSGKRMPEVYLVGHADRVSDLEHCGTIVPLPCSYAQLVRRLEGTSSRSVASQRPFVSQG